MMKKILGWFLVVHGIICVLAAFFPFYPPVLLFYWFSRIHFAINLIIVLVLGVSQVVFGGYLALKEEGRQMKWYWLAIIVVVLVLLLLVFPTLEGLFTRF